VRPGAYPRVEHLKGASGAAIKSFIVQALGGEASPHAIYEKTLVAWIKSNLLLNIQIYNM
jgi:hypothetical protein